MFETIWQNKLIKEFILFVVTATSLVLVAQLSALDALFEGGASLDELKAWASAAASAIGITAVRQAIAFALARLAGSQL